MNGLEKTLALMGGLAGTTATLIVCHDIYLLGGKVNPESLHCIVNDPRLLISAGAGIFTGAIYGIYRTARKVYQSAEK